MRQQQMLAPRNEHYLNEARVAQYGNSTCYMSNGHVAWPIFGIIGMLYLSKVYLPPKRWKIRTRLVMSKWQLVSQGCYIKIGGNDGCQGRASTPTTDVI